MISSVLTVVVGAVGYGGFNIYEGLTGGGGGTGGSGGGGSAPVAQAAPTQAKPLTAAEIPSVAATARTGYFHQPVIVDPSLVNGPLAKADRGLSPGVDASLRSLMSLTAQQGTAAQAMSGLTGTIGAKTGSAEAGTVQPNGWFLAYRDDVAASGVVLQGGHGGDSAGPIVAKVLAAAEG